MIGFRPLSGFLLYQSYHSVLSDTAVNLFSSPSGVLTLSIQLLSTGRFNEFPFSSPIGVLTLSIESYDDFKNVDKLFSSPIGVFTLSIVNFNDEINEEIDRFRPLSGFLHYQSCLLHRFRIKALWRGLRRKTANLPKFIIHLCILCCNPLFLGHLGKTARKLCIFYVDTSNSHII